MTLFLVDASKYQVERGNPLDLVAARQAGFGIVNIALDRGRAEDVLPGWAPAYAARARELGMGVSTYRWLDNRLGGAASARRAYDRMVALAGPANMAHIVDCEDNATEAIVRDYVLTMQSLLGRPIAIYTGDWWWTAPGRNWAMAGLTPYLHAAPNAGYLAGYPGETSPAWAAGYGGWSQLSLMQYTVAPLPGTGDCSLSAIRDPAVWAALTGGTSVGAYDEWMAAGKPVSGIARPVARLGQRLRSYGYTVYNIGDQSHLTHSPPEDHTPFSGTGWPATSPRWWIFADDIMPPPAGRGLPTLQQLGAQMIADARAGHPGMAWLKYQNWEPERDNGGACYQDRFMPTYERRASSDRGHVHQSCRSDMKDYTGADDYDPVARVRGQTGADMAFADDTHAMVLAWRAAALAGGTDKVTGGPLTGEPMWLVQEIKRQATAAAASAVREQAMIATVEHLTGLLVAGGGSTDMAALLAHIDERTNEVTGRIADLDADLDAARAENVELRRRLAEVLGGPAREDVGGAT